ncbi:acyltransferase family protein [Rhizobium calliandrae]|uniref:Acyltransferase family protein n=1 Tax=Rhizobium calliandrae TaxID=1312182 RepID=A0ABT7KND6_9HYPH|nr:acyltransferase family protein [Rhizobium calliandrae]MDL2410143.1 acyltransferase family protein [Rhizobium calliandrae]
MNLTVLRDSAPPGLMPQPAAGHLKYRADIDGLRALAILPVVLFHAGIPGFSGGFVGVDVFFVISGFLMASLISGEIGRDDFSILRFYERRIRRIFPALFAVLAASSVAAWLLLMPVELEYFARSLKAAALFTSNIQFKKESGYFDIGAQLKPLLHTWSLAVEEQFYILFPLLMIAVSRFARRHTVHILSGLLIVSFAASAWTVFRNPTAAFYLLQFRAWELILGAMLAFNVIPRPARPLVREALAALGVGLIAIAVFGFTDHTQFPGPAALLPCLGAALVIHAGAEYGLAGRALRAKPLVFVGLISYSLYLWHWPIIVFSREISGRELSPAQGGLIVLASFALATLSFRFVERPFRGRGGGLGRRSVFAAAAAVMVAMVVFCNYVIRDVGVPGRLPADVQRVYAATYDISRFGVPPCFADSDTTGPSLSDIRAGKLCPLGVDGTNPPAFLVWGDSHSGAMSPAIDGAAKQAGVSGLFAGHASCAPLPDARLPAHGGVKRCDDFNDAVRDLVTSKHIPLVFLIAYWPKYVHDAELPKEGVYFDPSIPPPLEDKSAAVTASLDRLMGELTQQGTKVVLVMDVPEMGHYMPEAIAKAMMTKTSTDVAPPWNYVAQRQALSRAILTRLAAKYGAGVVDPLPAICHDGQCEATYNGMPLYKDADHITAATSERLGYLFSPIFHKPGA